MGVLYEGIKAYREYWMRGAFQEVSYNEVRPIFCLTNQMKNKALCNQSILFDKIFYSNYFR